MRYKYKFEGNKVLEQELKRRGYADVDTLDFEWLPNEETEDTLTWVFRDHSGELKRLTYNRMTGNVA